MTGWNSEQKRHVMVKRQIEARNITDKLVLDAMRNVPRHVFVPKEYEESAYDDRPLPIGFGQTISQPYMVALMTEALCLKGDEKVLEIGTGSGYQAAILAEIVDHVVSIERIPELAAKAIETLRNLGYNNVEVVIGDGSKGYPARSPYDAIIVTAGAPRIPDALIDQLAEGGRLVIPVGSGFHQTLTRLIKIEGKNKIEHLEGCIFVPLVGECGWNESQSEKF